MEFFGPVDARVRRLDFSGFAQEFLRRNRDYQRQYAALGGLTELDPLAPNCQEMARSWGLTFPDLPKPRRRSQSGDLAVGHRPCGHRACPHTAKSDRDRF
ncbi:transcriptional regulator domain-containing protein [Novosphingobium kunmingense]|uniref:transcriptional regulator domain-containing protein n=1 Tax=Novosphingobium kunmingense TaxID=1211806 RepID=UPI001E4EFA23|nr:DUF6499 domain-containing protein [Novosphingobium kunmingense]